MPNQREYRASVEVTPQKIRDLTLQLVQAELDGETAINQSNDEVSCFTFLVEALDCCQESLYQLAQESGDPIQFQYMHMPYYHAISEGCRLAEALMERKYPLPPHSARLAPQWRRLGVGR